MIYICFGMTKSASTFLYQLTEETFRAAGRSPARLRPPLLPRYLSRITLTRLIPQCSQPFPNGLENATLC